MLDQDSIKLAILKKLTLHLEGITPVNEYVYDLSNSIYRGRLLYGEETRSPFLSIVENLQADSPTDVAGEENVMSVNLWTLLVQGVGKNDTKHPTDDLYQLMAATEHRLARLIARNENDGYPTYPTEHYLGLKDLKTISAMTIGPGIVSPPREGISSKAFFYLPLGINLVTDIRMPFVS